MSALRVGFEGFWWFDGPPSGRNVLRSVVETWADDVPEDELHLWVRSRDEERARDELGGRAIVHTLKLPNQGLSAMFELTGVTKRFNLAGLVTQNFTPLFGEKNHVFVHDVLFQSNPEWFSWQERLYLRGVTASARRASIVLTSSHTEAARIRRLNPDLGQVVPVGLGVSRDLVRSASRRPERLKADSFLLSVGRLNVRKNLGMLLEACALYSLVSPQNPLVVVGEVSGKWSNAEHNLDDSVLWLGPVDDGELRWLYERAEMLVFPSLDEGYGLPPIEALSFGCAVAVSDVPVFKELLSGHATYFDPKDSRSLADAVLQIRGSEESKPYASFAPSTWSSVVQNVRSVIERKDFA